MKTPLVVSKQDRRLHEAHWEYPWTYQMEQKPTTSEMGHKAGTRGLEEPPQCWRGYLSPEMKISLLYWYYPDLVPDDDIPARIYGHLDNSYRNSNIPSNHWQTCSLCSWDNWQGTYRLFEDNEESNILCTQSCIVIQGFADAIVYGVNESTWRLWKGVFNKTDSKK